MSVPQLGVGVNYSSAIAPLLDSAEGLVDVLEIEPQSLWFQWSAGTERYAVDSDSVARLAEIPCPTLLHGVGAAVGGTQAPPARQIPSLLDTISALDPAWVSEHLAFNTFQGPEGPVHTGFMLPPRQTFEGAEAAARAIRDVAAKLDRPFAVENTVSYLPLREDELPDGDWIAEVLSRTNGHLLLDLHNLWCNEQNGRLPVRRVIEQLPLDRVIEVHLAGGELRGGFWLDSHAGAVPEPVMEIAGEIVPRLPNLGAIVFEVFPGRVPAIGLDVVRRQLERLHALWERRSRARRPEGLAGRVRPTGGGPGGDLGPERWEVELGRAVLGDGLPGDAAHWTRAPGVALVRALLGQFRAGMVARALPRTIRLLLLSTGEAGTRSLLEAFWAGTPPERFASAEAERFGAFLDAKNGLDPVVSQILAFELAVLAALTRGESRCVAFDREPTALLDALGEGCLPENLPGGRFEVEVTPPPAPPHIHETHNVPESEEAHPR